ncbi:GNAT family N-acetyltransferase [Luteimonas saliphila]|uniref:GNAT family N-acetyltransferase n=1 Tax=Luteimonas saliphila TaxID=2804919 RepID=UPI00192E0E68
MSQVVDPEAIELIPIDLPNLHRLAVCEPVDLGIIEIPDGALPPAKVAVRALAQLELGIPAFWCVPLLIVSKSRQSVLGGCGFKTAPTHGAVEISYGVARSERGRGVATVAVGRLLQMAVSSGLVQEVVAHVLPRNMASSRVVARLGFLRGQPFVDTDGETVVPWVWRSQPNSSFKPTPLRGAA